MDHSISYSTMSDGKKSSVKLRKINLQEQEDTEGLQRLALGLVRAFPVNRHGSSQGRPRAPRVALPGRFCPGTGSKSRGGGTLRSPVPLWGWLGLSGWQRHWVVWAGGLAPCPSSAPSPTPAARGSGGIGGLIGHLPWAADGVLDSDPE